jgi:hypothetical protein
MIDLRFLKGRQGLKKSSTTEYITADENNTKHFLTYTNIDFDDAILDSVFF